MLRRPTKKLYCASLVSYGLLTGWMWWSAYPVYAIALGILAWITVLIAFPLLMLHGPAATTSSNSDSTDPLPGDGL
jgi:hypothetical protein